MEETELILPDLFASKVRSPHFTFLPRQSKLFSLVKVPAESAKASLTSTEETAG